MTYGTFLARVKQVEEFKDTDEFFVKIFYMIAKGSFPICDVTTIRNAFKEFVEYAEDEIRHLSVIIEVDENKVMRVKRTQESPVDLYSQVPVIVGEAMLLFHINILKKEYAGVDEEILRSYSIAYHTVPDMWECEYVSLRDAMNLAIKTGGHFNKGMLHIIVRRSGNKKFASVVESYRFLIELAKRNLDYENLIAKEFTEDEVRATDANCLYDYECRIPYEAMHKGKRDIESVEWITLFNGTRHLAKYRKMDLLERARITKKGNDYFMRVGNYTRYAGDFWNGKAAYTDAVDMLKKTAIKEYLKLELNLDSTVEEEKNLIRYMDIEQAKSESKD